ncbi:MAG: YicC family protein [Clostridia bacterium]|nr:YicC family protein [Clostridia bacterium]MBQ7289068.1 YicC family protein [Clostridia bacterium]
MLKSMTGYGRAEKVFGDLTVSVELKTVNHRFLEFTPKLPRGYAFLEEKLKAYVQRFVNRGKVDAYLTILHDGGADVTVEINHPMANGYISALRSLAETYHLPDDISVSVLSQYSDIFNISKQAINEEEITEQVLEVTDAALQSLIAMREIEGKKLQDDLLSRLTLIEDKVSFVEAQSPKTVAAYQQRLEQRIKDLLGDTQIDEQRLLTETAVFADKIAVSEETVRLRSHIKQFRDLLACGEPIGRKLDFIVQEMNRETNTIGSKAQDITIAHTVVDMKAEIEKIREQVQNIE